jgi:Tfp pilus assembly pilus retraction ATPase PilT
MDQLFIETSQGRFEWDDVGVGKMVSKSIILEPGEIIEIGWTTAGRSTTRNITMIDSIDRASKIEILLEGDTERLNISF